MLKNLDDNFKVGDKVQLSEEACEFYGSEFGEDKLAGRVFTIVNKMEFNSIDHLASYEVQEKGQDGVLSQVFYAFDFVAL